MFESPVSPDLHLNWLIVIRRRICGLCGFISLIQIIQYMCALLINSYLCKTS